jgi:Protein of unknown function (DUF2855)
MPQLRVRRDDLSSCELVEGEALRDDLAEGEAQLLVERFALTANNITYGLFGDQLGYWRLFPAPEGWGHIPAWGYARVVVSRLPALDEGRRVFGLVPMGRYVTVRPAPHSIGFADASPHRAELAPVYNQYLSVEGEGDDAALVMRPLFGTSLLLDLVLSEAGFDDAHTVVMTSASSKTAYGLAHLLRQRPVETVGLTSAARRDWVEGIGLYDTVLAYEDLGDLKAPEGGVLVDFAGDRGTIRGVHEQLGDTLRRSILVGFTHHEAQADEAPLRGPVPEFFFAPNEMAKRGRDLGQKYAQAWRKFGPVVERTMRIEHVTASDELLRVYRDLLEGRVDPAVGYVATL